MSRWWRAYDEAVDDPKLLLLPSDRHRWGWFCLMCLASAYGGTLPSIEVIALKLRMSKHKATELITTLVSAGLIDRNGDTFEPHNWKGRQYRSDVTDPTAAERMRNYRNRKRNEPVTVTPPRVQTTETDTEAEPDRKEETRAARALASDWPSDYRERFWREFPNKVGKADAFRRLDRLARSDKVAFATLMLALGRYANKTDDRPFCNPATWLNGERWSDEPAAAPMRQFSSAPPRPGSKEDNREKTHAAIQQLRGYIDAQGDDKGGGGDPGGSNAGLLPFVKPA